MKKQKNIYSIGALLLNLVFLWAIATEGIAFGFLGELDSDLTREFWLNYGLFCLLFGIGLFCIMRKIDYFDPDETSEEHDQTQRVSNDLLFFTFILGFLCFGLPMWLSPNSIVKAYYDVYLIFIIVSFAYLVLEKMYEQTRQKTKRFWNLGTKREYANIVFVALVGIIFVLAVAGLLPVFISGSLSESQEFILFQIFASIPAEELVFRGLAIMIFFRISHDIICKIAGFSEKEQETNETAIKVAYFIAIFVSSIIFGLYHRYRYGDDLYKIVYLTILGAILGLATYKRGLFTAFLIHAFNNLAPLIFSNIIYFLIVIIGALCLVLITRPKHPTKKNK